MHIVTSIPVVVSASAILLCLPALQNANAETYHWVDEKGIMHFSDNPPAIPRGKRSKVQVREDAPVSSSINNGSNLKNPGNNEITRYDQDMVRKRRLREEAEEQERKSYQARDRRLKEEQERLAQKESRELRRRLDTAPVQKSAEELGGFSVSSGST